MSSPCLDVGVGALRAFSHRGKEGGLVTLARSEHQEDGSTGSAGAHAAATRSSLQLDSAPELRQLV